MLPLIFCALFFAYLFINQTAFVHVLMPFPAWHAMMVPPGGGEHCSQSNSYGGVVVVMAGKGVIVKPYKINFKQSDQVCCELESGL